ncbi:hypothetical protein AQUCO_00100871v1 [Aquilegia coerulea]|uniref:Uncharacterized protein n=2 Tax=Aquilegia coerulea TaxID=218851 RepID=A0A2G5FCB9_AQUCA|nr:hypothetical protein AQUCO_00100871v1 [Aquilegia coerulea]
MELLTGQPALNRNAGSGTVQYTEHRSLVDLMLSALGDDDNPLLELTKVIDPNLVKYHKDSLFQMAILSKDCVDDDWKRRPDMGKVVLRLSYILACTIQGEAKDPDHRYLTLLANDSSQQTP